MNKREKWVNVVAGFSVTIMTVILICLILIWTGVLQLNQKVLKITSYSNEKVYDGSKLVATGYEITEGELDEGHELKMVVYGEQIEVGESDNYFSVSIIDQEGNNVTSEYQIIKKCGTLRVIEP